MQEVSPLSACWPGLCALPGTPAWPTDKTSKATWLLLRVDSASAGVVDGATFAPIICPTMVDATAHLSLLSLTKW